MKGRLVVLVIVGVIVLMHNSQLAGLAVAQEGGVDISAKGILSATAIFGTALHDAGLLSLTVDDDGGQSGWRFTYVWPDTLTTDHLYWNWLAIGYDGTVIDGFDLDWVNSVPITVTEPGSVADEESRAVFQDNSAIFQVAQEGFAWQSEPDNDYLLLKYVVTHQGLVPSDSVFLGHRTDFDINGEHGMHPSDRALYDTLNHIAWMLDEYTPGACAGIKILEGVRNGFHIGWESFDPQKWEVLRQPIIDPDAPTPNDYAFWLTAGPYAMLPPDSFRIGFGFLAGEDSSDIRLNAAACQTMWNKTMAPFLRRVVPSGDTTVTLGDSIAFCVEASDGFGDSLSYAWLLNGGMVPGADDSQCVVQFGTLGVDTLVVEVSDSWGNISTFRWWVTITPVGIGELSKEPPTSGIVRLQNHPNPLSESTVISYSLVRVGRVTLEMYDITGRLVEVLVNETQQPGIHQVRWNRKANPGGVYFYRLKACSERSGEPVEPHSLRAGESVETRKMVVLD